MPGEVSQPHMPKQNVLPVIAHLWLVLVTEKERPNMSGSLDYSDYSNSFFTLSQRKRRIKRSVRQCSLSNQYSSSIFKKMKLHFSLPSYDSLLYEVLTM